jgi:hypothetical protein
MSSEGEDEDAVVGAAVKIGQKIMIGQLAGGGEEGGEEEEANLK